MTQQGIGQGEKTVIAFDLYGTLLSTASIAKELTELLEINAEKASEVATVWRRYQLEYTWRLSCMKIYKPFSQITLSSLHHTLLDLSLSIPASQKSTFDTSILTAYNSLTTFPDAASGLEYLQSSTRNKLDPYIFSNGTSSMLQCSMKDSPSLSSFCPLFNGKIISVEETRCFKPCKEVYEYLIKQTGKGDVVRELGKEEKRRIWLVSGNPFDVVGAKAVGMSAVWVDREGVGWKDALLEGEEDVKPDLIVSGVEDAIKGVEGWYDGWGEKD